MHTIWRSLAWKEWHEHKWKLVALTTILCGVTWPAALAIEDGIVEIAVVMVGICIVPLAMFIGLGEAAGERSRGTLQYLQALPAPMWQVALCKLVLGLFTILAALALAGVWIFVVSLFFSERVSSLPHELLRIAVPMVILFAVGIYFWCAAFGVNRKHEVSAGAASLAAMIGWWIVLFVLWDVLLLRSVSQDTARLRAVALATVPFGVAMSSALGFAFVTASVTQLLLGIWYVRRFGRMQELEVRSQENCKVVFCELTDEWVRR